MFRHFIFAIALLTLASTTSARSQKYILYANLTEKDAVTSYYAKFLTDTKDLTVTTRPADSAQIIEVSLEQGEALEVIELDSSFEVPVTGEIGRLEHFVLRIRKSSDPLHENFHFHGARLIDPSSAKLIHVQSMHNKISVSNFVARSDMAVDREFLKMKLAEYSGAVEFELDGVKQRITERGSDKGRELARAFLKQEYEKLGYKTKIHEFKSGSRIGKNFIAERAGQSSRYLIVSSHMDSVSNSGANDDGSGTVAALGIAKALATQKLQHSIRFIAFDLEELGMEGSSPYVEDLVKNPSYKTDLMGVFHMDMIGINLKNSLIYTSHCDRNQSKTLSDAFVNTSVQTGMNLNLATKCIGRSDHTSFWAHDIPAILVVEGVGFDGDPCYHQKCDTAEKIDYEYLTKIATAVARTSAGFVGRN